MPVYTYQCEKCGVRFEHASKFADPPLTRCPECGEKLRKVYQPVGIVFKGSGFYATDHRSPSGQSKFNQESKSSESKSSSESSASSTSSAPGSSSSSDTSSSSNSSSSAKSDTNSSTPKTEK